eukprot:9478985-Pyramimonas_sp.AAC.1
MAPWCLFLVLDQPDLAESVMETPPCMLDAWSRQFLADHDLRTPEARALLALHVHLLKTNTDHLEIGNAHSRRFTKKQVQCKQLDAGQLSERMMAQKYFYEVDFKRLGKVGKRTGVEGGPDEQPAAGDAPPEEPKGSGGGPWRAFVHEQESNDLRALGVEYRELKAKGPDDPTMAEYIRKGKLVTKLRREGRAPEGGSFGPKPSVL